MSASTSSSIPTLWHMDCITRIHTYQLIENYDKNVNKTYTGQVSSMSKTFRAWNILLHNN